MLIFRLAARKHRPEGVGAVAKPLSCALLALFALARRAPMFVFEFDAALLQLMYHSPAFAALLQLPPT